MKIQEIINFLETSFPLNQACQWDYSGWQIKANNLDAPITNIMVTLDVTHQSVTSAIEHKAKLIICHHPFLFGVELKDLKKDRWKYSIYQKLIKNNISVYVMHTNFDKNINGMNMLIAKDLNIAEIKYFDNEKLAIIGKYDNIPLLTIVNKIKKYFSYDKVTVVTNDLNNNINETIVSSGASGSLIHEIKDYSMNQSSNILFITGEMKWHQQIEATDKNINVIIVGHGMEEKFIEHITKFLNTNNYIKDYIAISKFFVKNPFFI